MSEVRESGGFAVAMHKTGPRGCHGIAGKCTHDWEYVIGLVWCRDCMHTERSCLWLRHDVEWAYVHACNLCARRLLLWDSLLVFADRTTPEPVLIDPDQQ